MKLSKLLKSPILLPILFFITVILLGSILLHGLEESTTDALSWTDAVFTATSAACVTGLVVVDTGSYFSPLGQAVILCLMQVGGLGIMTFTSLSIYIWRRRTTITDRIAVGQILLHDATFNLGRFLIEIVCWTFLTEAIGAALLYIMDPVAFSPFSALFHAVSAFCNAGFSLFRDSLMGYKGHWGVNLVFMALIVVGGIGFSVLVEVKSYLAKRLHGHPLPKGKGISWYAGIVIRTSLLLIVLGWAAIYFAEFVGYNRMIATEDAILTSLFQSVTARTAGFNSLDISQMTNVSLMVLLFLMFIGGAPGSCAGGIKVTTLRVLAAAIWSQMQGRSQAAVGKFAIRENAVKKAMVLFLVASLIIFLAAFLLDFTEGGDMPHSMVRGQFLEILFESVSAFCTVGLSTGLTTTLSIAGKWIIIALMFIGRLGPFVLIAALQSVQETPYYRLPEESIMIG
jgi:trk system potassium uptake protein TrkH